MNNPVADDLLGKPFLEFRFGTGCKAGPVSVPGSIRTTGFVRVFPNPASGMLNVTTTAGDGPKEITLLNALGQKVFHCSNEHRSDFTINTSGLQHGIYVLQVRTSKQLAVRSVVINQ